MGTQQCIQPFYDLIFPMQHSFSGRFVNTSVENQNVLFHVCKCVPKGRRCTCAFEIQGKKLYLKARFTSTRQKIHPSTNMQHVIVWTAEYHSNLVISYLPHTQTHKLCHTHSTTYIMVRWLTPGKPDKLPWAMLRLSERSVTKKSTHISPQIWKVPTCRKNDIHRGLELPQIVFIFES